MHYYLVTTHNHQAFIGPALQSVITQYASESEFLRQARILVIDDASTDNTKVELVKWETRWHNTKVHTNATNKGIGFNRNHLLNWFAALQPSDTDVVMFLDGDDILPKGSLSRKLTALEADPTLEVVGGQLGVFYGDDMANVHVVDTFPLDEDILAIADMFECHFYISNALFRAPVFISKGCRFPETATSEDWLFFGMHPLRKRHVPEVTLLYRRHPSNVTTAPLPSEFITQVRTQTRVQRLLRCGMLPSKRDIELLDLVGYLSLRVKWVDQQGVLMPNIWLPWFRLLENRSAMDWPALKTELNELFRRIQAHNQRAKGLHQGKLDAYLTRILEEAERASLKA